jgi:membrane protein YqaA with SNARE-associated domain
MLGYLIGALLYDSIGQWIVRLWGYGDKIEAVRQAFADYGAWIILGKGVTPIPYKIVTIASGFAGYNFGLFVALSFLTRGARFFAEAFLLKRYGPRARVMIEKRLGFWVTISALVLVAGIVAVFYLL